MADAPYIVGVDIGGTKVACVLADAEGRILARRWQPTRASEGWQAVVQQLFEMTEQVLAGTLLSQVRGIGVSCGGPLDSQRGIVYSPPNLPGWDAVPVKQLFEERFGLPTRLENDANATALAEHRFGAGQGTRNMVFMTWGTGIGGGLILDGKLYRGTNDLAGEIGHTTVLLDGPACGCGKRGCLESLASGPSIARRARELANESPESLVWQRATPDEVTAQHIVEAAQDGDTFARFVLSEAATYMGIGIANVAQILNPERVVLGTIAVKAGELVLEPLRRALAVHAWQRVRGVLQVVPAKLGDRAQDLAAICLWLDD
ncbi:MAG: ROK family protein [Armatimonadota bacterium]|nr:ROK family protein [bacterium]MDW8321586.1 ROK family protein [Armatimonadota bacterium]